MKQWKILKIMKNMQQNSKNRTIILTGMMGAGKSTVGSVLSRKLKLGFIDLDTLIENTQKLSISEIFKTFGEESFRKMECDTVCSIEPGRKLVISTGGGVVESKETIENLRKTGRIYYLEAPADVLYERIKDDTKRPLLMTKDPKKTLKEILDKRRIKYECADFEINTANKTAKEIVDEIVEIYEKINS